MLFIRCRACTLPVRADHRWCPECGTTLPEVTEHVRSQVRRTRVLRRRHLQTT